MLCINRRRSNLSTSSTGKILELIAMASLVVNRKAMAEVYAGFEKSWNAEYLLKDIERINPHFYPKPIIEVASTNPSRKSDWQERAPDYLTRDEFVRLYKRCGGILHADNPLGRKTNYPALYSQMSQWRTKILNLLNCHHIRLVGDKNIYLIHMKEDRDDKVHGYIFSPIGECDS